MVQAIQKTTDSSVKRNLSVSTRYPSFGRMNTKKMAPMPAMAAALTRRYSMNPDIAIFSETRLQYTLKYVCNADIISSYEENSHIASNTQPTNTSTSYNG
jgi:hypothetical protein